MAAGPPPPAGITVTVHLDSDADADQFFAVIGADKARTVHWSPA
jgi:hypothetical protein